VIDCNEWKTQRRHECTNMGKVKRLKLLWQLYVTLLPERDVRNIRPLDFCSIECTLAHCVLVASRYPNLLTHCDCTVAGLFSTHNLKSHSGIQNQILVSKSLGEIFVHYKEYQGNFL